jgi:putative transposase
MPDHIHLCLSIPPKFSVADTIGFLKGKSAVRIHRDLMGHCRMTGLHFWATGYCVSTIGLDEERIRQYIRDQEQFASGQGDLDLKKAATHGPDGAFPNPMPPSGSDFPGAIDLTREWERLPEAEVQFEAV